MYINTFQCKVDQTGSGNDPLSIMEPLPCGPRRDRRPHTAVRRFFGSLYLSADHRQRMEDLRKRMGYRRGRDTPAYYAVMYLLTSNESLYHHTANIVISGITQEEMFRLKDVVENRTQTAKDTQAIGPVM